MKVKVITNVVGRKDNTINTSIGEFSFNSNGVSQEIEKEKADELVSMSEGTIEILDEKNGNFDSKIKVVTKEKTKEDLEDNKKDSESEESKETNAKLMAEKKAAEDAELSKELAKKTVPQLQEMAKGLDLKEEEYFKLSKVDLIKYLVGKS